LSGVAISSNAIAKPQTANLAGVMKSNGARRLRLRRQAQGCAGRVPRVDLDAVARVRSRLEKQGRIEETSGALKIATR
jgi:hypothetical protein